MSGLLFLSSDDFTINKGTKGNILCNTIPGFSLILFYSNACHHCQQLLPVFKGLPGTIGGCQFGMLNVSTNKNCVRMAKNTITAIEYVPLLILYINGRPFIKYNGEYQENEIKSFILEVANKVNNKQKFSDKNVQEDVRGGIPDYTIGHPLYGLKNVVYLEFDMAYDNGNKRPINNDNLFSINDGRNMQQNMVMNAFKNTTR